MRHIMILCLTLLLMSCDKESLAVGNVVLSPESNENSKTDADTMTITIGNTTFTATLADNASATAFKTQLPLTLNMADYNNNEKVGSLSKSLPTSASNPGTIRTGDIMLFGSSSLVLFYETFSTSYSYTRVGQIDNVSELKSVLGTGNPIVKFELR